LDLKNGGIAAAAAFVLSFLIGLLSRSTMPLLIVWPLVFAVVFFILFNVVKFLFNQFLPELLDEESGSNSGVFPGAVVNIMEGDNPGLGDEYSDDSLESGGAVSWQASDAFANAARPDDSEKSMGDISTLSDVVARNKAAYKGPSADVSTGIDQNMENDYNTLGEFGNAFQPMSPVEAAAFGAAGDTPARAAAKPAKSGSHAWYSSSDDTLPDLDSMAGVFTNTSAEEESETADHPDIPRSRKKTSDKEKSLEGDFSPKEIAEGIRTVLKKDKED